MARALTIVLSALLLVPLAAGSAGAAQVPLASTGIPQFVDPLPIPQVVDVTGGAPLTLTMCEFQSYVLPTGTIPGYAGTWTWGYQVGTRCPTAPQQTYLGPVLVARRNVPAEITFVNNLPDSTISNVPAWKTSTDQTLHWADPLNFESNMCAMSVAPGMPPMFPCDQSYIGPVPAVVHLHGGEVPPVLDGGPEAWFTADGQYKGSAYYTRPGAAAPPNGATYRYPNTQEAAPIWFHDHALGITRLNVYAGMAGAYLLTDPGLSLPATLTPLADTIPLVIQDRMFDTTGQLLFPAAGINPEHPFWVPEFIGDTIAVNGKVWPFLAVEPKRYRFLFLNGSNARTYAMSFSGPGNGASPTFWQIGTDGGYLDAPAAVPQLIMMPGERADVIIDFSRVAPGTNLILTNTAKAPYPGGRPVNGLTTGRILQFRVTACASGLCGANDPSFNPATPGAFVRTDPAQRTVRLAANGALKVTPAKTRQLTLNEVMGMKMKVGAVQYPGGPLEILVNNTKFSGESYGALRSDFVPVTIGGITTGYSEVMNEGDTEVWEIVNLTADAHPMHMHLTQFQLVDRRALNTKGYAAAYNAAFGTRPLPAGCPPGAFCPGFGPPLDYSTGNARALGGNPDVTPFLAGAPILPAANETGWKDTVMVPPGMVTRIAVRFAPTDTPANNLSGTFPFDPNAQGHGYVWHCHIIDHEDNEMMRPDLVVGMPGTARTYVQGIDY